MGRKRKCQICGEWIESNDDSVPYKTGYCHKHCFNVAMKVVTTEKKKRVATTNKKSTLKPQKELKDGLTEEEFQEKKKLCDYLRNLTQKDLPVKTYKLIDDYRKKYKITFTQIREDLVYYFEVLNNPVEGDAIGIIPYCHTEAQEYYSAIKESHSSCESHLSELPQMYSERRIKVNVDMNIEKPQIDLSAIGGD